MLVFHLCCWFLPLFLWFDSKNGVALLYTLFFFSINISKKMFRFRNFAFAPSLFQHLWGFLSKRVYDLPQKPEVSKGTHVVFFYSHPWNIPWPFLQMVGINLLGSLASLEFRSWSGLVGQVLTGPEDLRKLQSLVLSENGWGRNWSMQTTPSWSREQLFPRRRRMVRLNLLRTWD